MPNAPIGMKPVSMWVLDKRPASIEPSTMPMPVLARRPCTTIVLLNVEHFFSVRRKRGKHDLSDRPEHGQSDD